MTGGIKAYPGSASSPSYTFGSSTNDGFFLSGTHQIGLAIAGTLVGFFNANGFNTTAGQPTGVPVGTVQDFAGSSAPSGWYLCHGQAVSRTTYATLFGIIGTTYGAGDGISTFNLPDLRGRATFGQDNMGGTAANRITAAGGNFDGTVLGGSGGQQNVTLTGAQLPVTTPTFTGTPVTPTFTGGAQSPTTVAQWNGATGNFGQSGSGVVLAYVRQADMAEISLAAPAGTISTITPAGTVSSFGSGSSTPVLSNAFIFNKIIFAGA